VERIGIPDRFIEHGPVAKLHEVCGMDEKGIYNVITSLTK
jgi:1-deoxy-D-xylulose-5-phosphate synthase